MAVLGEKSKTFILLRISSLTEKSRMTFGQYRREMRDENPWTKVCCYLQPYEWFVRVLRLILQGGRGHCIGRFICCTLMIAIFMIVSIVLALALVSIFVNPFSIFTHSSCFQWIRPPSIVIGTAGLTSAGTSGVRISFR